MTDSTFFGGLKVASVTFAPSIPTEQTRLADGSVVKASLGATLWQGTAQLAPSTHADAAEVEAKLAKLMRPGETFFAYDPRYNGPRSDPGGVILGAATPTIHTLDADNRRLRVTGLHAGYVLSVGDYIGWQYGSSPTRYALHRVETAATADGAGLTPLFAVEPHIRPGVAVSAAVALVRPRIKAQLLSVAYGQGVPVVTSGVSLSFTQTLR